jgi:hypothetical protein
MRRTALNTITINDSGICIITKSGERVCGLIQGFSMMPILL